MSARALTLQSRLWLAAALIPPAAVAYIIARFGVDVPYWDDWAMAAFLVKAHQHGVGFGDFVAIHNEGRLVIPRILALIEARFVHWDKRASMAMSLVFTGIAAVAWFRIARRTLGNAAPAAIALASLYLFSILQFLNWLWAFQTALFIPAACLAAAIWVAGTKISGRTRLAIVTAITLFATYSFTNGMFLWLLLPPLLWISDGVPRKAILRIWPIAAAATLIPYFIHFKRATWVPTWGQAASRPVDIVQYVLAFLGMPIGWNTRDFAPVTCMIGGALLLALFALALIYIWRHRKEPALLPRTAPWLALACYSLMSAFAASVGRATGANAMVQRYVTFSTDLVIALIFLAAVIGNDLRTRRPELATKVKRICQVLAVAAVAANLLMLPILIERMQLFRSWHLSSKGATELIELGESSAMHRRIYPFETGSMVEQILAIDECGLMQPRVVRDFHLNTGALAGSPSSDVFGKIERLVHDENGYSLGGWAVLPNRRDPADCVIIGADMADGSSVAIAFDDQFDDRQDISDAIGKSFLTCGWVTIVPANVVPPGTKGISAWAFDATNAKAYRLSSSSP